MEKNITQIAKRISDIKNINKISLEGGAINEEVIILTEIAKLKRFKYEEFSYLHFVKEISNMKMMTIGIQQNITDRFKLNQQEKEIKLINSVLELYLMVIEILVGYLDRNQQKSNKLTFVEEKKNRLCPICSASIEQNKLSNIRKGIDATWVSALKFVSIQTKNEQIQQTEQNHEIDEEIIDDEDYIKMIDKILSSKTLYTSKKSYTSAVLQQTFNLNVQRRVEDINATLTDNDVRSAKDAMDYAMRNLQFEFKDQMIENLVPVLYRLVMKYRDAQKKKHEAEFLNIDTQTEQFNEVKQLKLLQQKAEIMYRNLYHKTNQVQQLKKTVKKLETQNKSSTNQLEVTVRQLIVGNKLLTQTKRKLQIQIMKYQEQVCKLQKQIHDFQILQSRRNSNRKSSVFTNKAFINQQQIDQIQNEKAQDSNVTKNEISETNEICEVSVKVQTERSNFKISNTFLHSDRDKSSVSKSKNSQSQLPLEQNNNQIKTKIKPIRNVSNKINLLSYNRSKDKEHTQIDNNNQQLDQNRIIVQKEQNYDQKQTSKQIKQRIIKQQQNGNNHHNTIEEGDEEIQSSAQNSTVILSNSISMKNSMVKKKGSRIIDKNNNNHILTSNKSSNQNSEHSININDNRRESYISNTTKKNFIQHISKKNKKQSYLHQDVSQYTKNKENYENKQITSNIDKNQQHTYQNNLSKKHSNTHHVSRTQNNDLINQSQNNNIGNFNKRKHKQSLNNSEQSSSRNSKQYINSNNGQNGINSWQSQHPSLDDIDFDNFDQSQLLNYPQQKQAKILVQLLKRNQKITKKSYQSQQSSFNNQTLLPYNGNSLHSNLTTDQNNCQYNEQNMNRTLKKHNKVLSDIDKLKLHENSITLETLYHSSLPSKRQQTKTFKLFNSKDLNQLFGSVEQAYQLQSSKSQSKLKISTKIKQFIEQVFDHVNLLKKSNIDLYDWIRSFLKFPYQTAINNNNSSDLASSLSQTTFQFYFGRMVSLHQKCRPVTNRKYCHHLKGFLSKIKFKLQQSDKNSINLPLIDKK